MIEILRGEKRIMPMDVVAKWLRRGSMCVFPTFRRVASQGYGRRTSPIRVVGVVAVAFSGVLSASAQQPEDLQQQLQQLKQQYDATTRDLEQRIAALEQQIHLLEYLLQRFDHVAVERVCSGIGVPNIYEYLRDTEHLPERPEVAQLI